MNIEEKLLSELNRLVGHDLVKQSVIKECLQGLTAEQRGLVRLEGEEQLVHLTLTLKRC